MDGNFMECGKLFVEKGEALTNLGNALQNPKTKIDQLVELADAAGFGLEVAMLPKDDPDKEANTT